MYETSKNSVLEMTKKYHTKHGRYIIKLPNPFKFNSHQRFREMCESLDHDDSVEFDLRHVTSIDSSALGMLMLAHEYFGKDRNRLFLSHIHTNVKSVFDVARMDVLYTMH
ncbi:STAS domain-containing protein [Magnetococcus sp. PR-3]|uniref:STAS domain-containing protein n=1 Tax=Magnetococcus sp. PR-3 TaxID=3120355 RepID=UPI002FCE5BF4